MCKEHQLYLLTFIQDKTDYKYLEELEQIFDEVHLVYQPFWKSVLHCIPAIFTGTSFQLGFFRNRKFQHLLEEFYQAHTVDATHVQHLRMSQYAPQIKGPKMLDLPDAYSLYWERRKKVKRKWYNVLFDAVESRRVLKAENAVHRFDLNLVCSSEDRDFLIQKHQVQNIKLLRNGVDLDLFKFNGHDYAQNKTLLFTGNMDYAPNIDAVVHFVSNSWPDLKKEFPQLKLIIAGQRPVSEVMKLHGNGVEVTGFVPDMAEMYRQASIVIAPLRFGAGTQNKVLEAMAMGIPVVCTEIGFKGLEIESGEGCILSENDLEFSQNVKLLLGDESLRKTVGQKGLKVAAERFSWDSISDQLVTYCQSISKAEK
jgi:glycosyltransferase involved in cell wall biosynthesis